MLFLQTFISLLFALTLGYIKAAHATVIHDGSFVPDGILHISSGERKQSCVPAKEILLVNGTSPGPELRFTEGKTVWIRVFNDIADQNLTMVIHLSTVEVLPVPHPSLIYLLFELKNLEVVLGFGQPLLLICQVALARPYNGSSALLRWHSFSIPMAYSSSSFFRLRASRTSWNGGNLFLPFTRGPSGHLRYGTFDCKKTHSSVAPLIVTAFSGIGSSFRRSTTDISQIEEADCPPYEYDDDRIIFLQDVFEETEATIEAGLLDTPLVYQGDQTMVLINGKGGGLTNNGAVCNETLSVINVECGKTYRLRLIGGTALSFDSIAIEGHENLEVIEADGYFSSSLTLPLFFLPFTPRDTA